MFARDVDEFAQDFDRFPATGEAGPRSRRAAGPSMGVETFLYRTMWFPFPNKLSAAGQDPQSEQEIFDPITSTLLSERAGHCPSLFSRGTCDAREHLVPNARTPTADRTKP